MCCCVFLLAWPSRALVDFEDGLGHRYDRMLLAHHYDRGGMARKALARPSFVVLWALPPALPLPREKGGAEDGSCFCVGRTR